MNDARERLDNIASAIEDGSLTIFVGAGMSAAVGIPTANELFKLLRARDPRNEHLHEKVDSLAVAYRAQKLHRNHGIANNAMLHADGGRCS